MLHSVSGLILILGPQRGVVRLSKTSTYSSLSYSFHVVSLGVSMSWCDVMQSVSRIQHYRPRITNHYCKPNSLRHPVVSLRKVIYQLLHVACGPSHHEYNTFLHTLDVFSVQLIAFILAHETVLTHCMFTLECILLFALFALHYKLNV